MVGTINGWTAHTHASQKNINMCSQPHPKHFMMSKAAPQVGPMLSAGRLLIAVVVVLCLSLQINVSESKASECCAAGDQTPFCKTFSSLNSLEQQELRILLGNRCEESVQSMTMEKRKPNFIRFGRSLGNSMHGSDPNFLRFGRSSPMIVGDEETSNWVMEKRSPSGVNANFLRFGKSSDPNFLRFGKRSSDGLGQDSAEPNFLRFGRKIPANNNFLRFGRSAGDEVEKFDREYRKPNFLRFG